MATYARVDPNHPFVGLNNQVCSEPKHYCCIHDVWLSEEDSRKRHCRSRDKDGSGCTGFREDHYSDNIDKLLWKTRQVSAEKHSNTRYRKSSRKR